MKQFRIKLTKYSEEGAPTSEYSVTYFDNEENAKNFYNEYNAMRYENKTKMYKVDLSTLAYKKIDNPDTFFAQFEA